MAEASVKTERKVILELSENEALWLKSALQNPILLEDEQNDGNDDYRREILEVLRSIRLSIGPLEPR